jgi:hypothetical protein
MNGYRNDTHVELCEACGAGRCKYDLPRARCAVPKGHDITIENYTPPEIRTTYGPAIRPRAPDSVMVGLASGKKKLSVCEI